MSVIFTTECKTTLYVIPESHDCLRGLVLENKKKGHKASPPEKPLQSMRLCIPTNCVLVFNHHLVQTDADYRHDNMLLHLYLHYGIDRSKPSMPEDVYTLDGILGNLGVKTDVDKYFHGTRE